MSHENPGGYIYVITEIECHRYSPFVKIGFAGTNVERRRCDLQVGNPRILHVLVKVWHPGADLIEARLKTRFEGFRAATTEWFLRTPRINHVIRAMKRAKSHEELEGLIAEAIAASEAAPPARRPEKKKAPPCADCGRQIACGATQVVGPWLTVEEVATFAGLDVELVNDELRHSKLKGSYLGGRRSKTGARIAQSSVDSWWRRRRALLRAAQGLRNEDLGRTPRRPAKQGYSAMERRFIKERLTWR